jgi:outer membrane biosynthesis protein TonB
MEIIKGIFKKLLIAAITGAIVLAFVYFKDKYLSKGDTDPEILQEITHTKESKKEPTQEPVATPAKTEPIQEEPTKIVVEVEKPTLEVQEEAPIQTASAPQEKIKKPIEQTSFEEYKNSMGYSGQHNKAFDELDKETR